MVCLLRQRTVQELELVVSLGPPPQILEAEFSILAHFSRTPLPRRFGFGNCKCYSGWSGGCCNDWSVSDWEQKVSKWNEGESCEAQPNQACNKVSNSPAIKTWTPTWTYPPDTSKGSQSSCEQAGCMWVDCFQSSNNQFNSPPADEMCSNCDGPWKGKCEWHHYVAGALAFAGPGEHCGFKYPACPSSKGSNCFCEASAINALKTGWCNNGDGMGTFCPNAIDHGGGRTQECAWNGWTVSPQANGGIEESCSQWGASMSGNPAAIADNKISTKMENFQKVEPGATVEGTQISGASCIFLGAGAFLMKKRGARKARGAEGGDDNLEMLGEAQTV